MMINILRYLLFLSLILNLNCSSFKSGTYETICLRYHSPEISIIFYDNNTFQYFLTYVDEEVTGTWSREGNILTLKSEYFTREEKEFDIQYQYTQATGKDIYKIFGKKLLIMSSDGNFSKKCYLKRTDGGSRW